MTDFEKLYQAFLSKRAICTDTRKVTHGCIFFALKGDNFNGNLFAAEALQKGAAYAVVEEPIGKADMQQVFVVDDVLLTLQDLARKYRQSLSCTIIGLTGSNGKTTCKELIRDVMATKFKTVATIGNLNNHIGVPLTVLAIPPDAEMAVVEMGANHQKEIALLSSICQPDWGYITNFGKAHLEGFGGVEGVIKGKSELYDFLRENNKSALVLGDNHLQMEKSKGINKITFGEGLTNDIIVNKHSGDFASIRFAEVTIQSKLTGDFQYTNLAAAVAFGYHFGVELTQIKKAIENYEPKMNRSEWRLTTNNEVLLDAYNANPDSVSAAIDAFAKLNKPMPWFILGDMFELGDYTKKEHKKIVNQLEAIHANRVLLIGAHFCEAAKGIYPTVKTTEEAATWLSEKKLMGCTILLKGSRGMALEKLLAVL